MLPWPKMCTDSRRRPGRRPMKKGILASVRSGCSQRTGYCVSHQKGRRRQCSGVLSFLRLSGLDQSDPYAGRGGLAAGSRMAASLAVCAGPKASLHQVESTYAPFCGPDAATTISSPRKSGDVVQERVVAVTATSDVVLRPIPAPAVPAERRRQLTDNC